MNQRYTRRATIGIEKEPTTLGRRSNWLKARRTELTWSTTAGVILLLAGAVCTVAREVETRVILELPNSCDKDTIVLSRDGKSIAFLSVDSTAVVQDGKAGPTFAQCGRPQFAPMSDTVFYAARRETSGKQEIVVVVGDKSVSTSFASEPGFVFSQDGKRWAAIGGEPGLSGQVVVIVDGEVVGRYRDACYPTFSPNGKHCAYLIDDEGSKKVVADGVTVKTFPKPEVDVSKDTRAFVVGPNMHVLHKTEFMSDGTLLILTQGARGWSVYRNDDCLAAYPHNVWGGGRLRRMVWGEFKDKATIASVSLTTAEDAAVAVWWERIEGTEDRWRVVRDGKPVDDIVSTDFWDAQSPALSRDGIHCAYVARAKGREEDKSELFLVVDGRKFGPYRHVWGIGFSDNGEHFAYAASDGSGESPWSFYHDGRPFAPKCKSVYPPKLSMEGNHCAWVGTRDGKEVIGMDGEELGAYDDKLWGPTFLESGTVTWVVRNGDNLVEVSAKLE
jgi:hypothetical protein